MINEKIRIGFTTTDTNGFLVKILSKLRLRRRDKNELRSLLQTYFRAIEQQALDTNAGKQLS
jgi:hypothetical protein